MNEADHPRHPFRRAATRQLALADPERHIADLVRLVLLSGPGERLHRPEFGAGLGMAALFEPLNQSGSATLEHGASLADGPRRGPLDGALGSVVEVRARGSLERVLGDRIELLAVHVRVDETTLHAEVRYRVRPAGDERRTLVTLGGGT